jgi:hypothetical protein
MVCERANVRHNTCAADNDAPQPIACEGRPASLDSPFMHKHLLPSISAGNRHSASVAPGPLHQNTNGKRDVYIASGECYEYQRG